jgi:chemotaxis-related protein WspB
MLLLLFKIENGRYALDIKQIVEIAPLVKLKKIPVAPDFVAGLMNYRGEGVPVIDLGKLIDDVPAKNNFSTRVIIVENPFKGHQDKYIGLIASTVTETIKTDLTKAPSTGVLMDKSLYKGDEAPDTEDMIQWFDLKKMLPEDEINALFEEEEPEN